MAYKRISPTSQIEKPRRNQLPEYGQLINTMQTETASIINDYIRQYIGVIGDTPKPGSGIFINWDRVLRSQTYQELAWYDLYWELEHDPHISAIMGNAKLNVAGMTYNIQPHVEAGDKQPIPRNKSIADFVTHALGRTKFFPQHLYDLLDAIGKGFAVSEIIWEITDDGVMIKDILNRPQRRFQFDAADRSLRLRDTKQPYFGIELPDKKFIVHRVSTQWANPFGDAIDQSLYWMWLFKKTVMKFWMQHLQVGASSIPIVKHPASANDKLKAEALAVAEMIRNGAFGRIPDSFELIWAEAKNAITNAEAYSNFIRTVNDEMAKAVNGQTLTSESSSSTGTGTMALGKVHQGTQSSRDTFRARGLEATINATLIRWLVDFNFAKVEGYPKFTFEMEAPDDMSTEANIVRTLSAAGFDFDEKELSEKFQYTLKKKQPLQLGGPKLGPDGKPLPPDQQDKAPDDKETDLKQGLDDAKDDDKNAESIEPDDKNI